MSIRFKFRSSVNFDSVDIDGARASISVRELRSKIILQKHLNICQDFDLVFSDALTGREYNDDKIEIPSGSSVIIKRVPAGTVPSAVAPIGSAENHGIKDSNVFVPAGGQVDDFDDFGIDLCPVPGTTFPVSDPDLDVKISTSNGKENIADTRLRCQKLEASDLSETSPRGSNHWAEAKIINKRLESKLEEHMKLEKVANANYLDLQTADLPSELKCPLCNTFFKEAVMIPCCQHSFCEKCIRQILIARAKCPKCSSSKCRVEDLLPNLSLRSAIEHFLEAQILDTGSENALRKYAPDGESGIQAGEVSCAVAVPKRKLDVLSSSFATEKGSNQIMTEPVYESLNKKNGSLEASGHHLSNLNAVKTLKSAPSSIRVKHLDVERDQPEDFAVGAYSQGENQPLNLPQNHVLDEADSTLRRRDGLSADPGGGGRSFIVPSRNRKADRTCYMCGSPDHFIRDCPVASTPRPMFQTGDYMFHGNMRGYASPYWNSTSFPPIRPYVNMYGNPGMVPFNVNMVPPVAPYAVPHYFASMYGGFPAPSGGMRMGGPSPVGARAERPVNHSEFLELQDFENRTKLPNKRREHPSDYEDDDSPKHYRYNELERLDGYKSHTERERSVSNSEDSLGRKIQRRHRHDKHLGQNIQSGDERYDKGSRSTISGRERTSRHSERSNSGIEDIPSSTNRYSEGRHKDHHGSSKKHHESRGQSGSDSSWSRRHSKRQRDIRSSELDVWDSKHKHNSHSSSGMEPCSSGDQKRRSKDVDYSHGLRDTKDRTKSITDELGGDRWQMASSLDEDGRDGYHHHKRKRVL